MNRTIFGIVGLIVLCISITILGVYSGTFFIFSPAFFIGTFTGFFLSILTCLYINKTTSDDLQAYPIPEKEATLSMTDIAYLATTLIVFFGSLIITVSLRYRAREAYGPGALVFCLVLFSYIIFRSRWAQQKDAQINKASSDWRPRGDSERDKERWRR